LKLKYKKALLNFAFKFNLRRYSTYADFTAEFVADAARRQRAVARANGRAVLLPASEPELNPRLVPALKAKLVRCDESVSNCAPNFNLRRYITVSLSGLPPRSLPPMSRLSTTLPLLRPRLPALPPLPPPPPPFLPPPTQSRPLASPLLSAKPPLPPTPPPPSRGARVPASASTRLLGGAERGAS
jgi:hypothetical protein